MPLQTQNFLGMGVHTPDYSGLGNIVSNYYKGQELADTPRKLAAQKLRDELMNSILQTQEQYAGPMAQLGLEKGQLENKYYGRGKESEIAKNLAAAQHYKDVSAGRTFAPSTLGKLIQEKNDLAAKNPNDPLIAEYDRVIKTLAGGKQYAPSSIGKLANELLQVQEGFLPGSNGTVPLTSDQQQQLTNQYMLQMQKSSTDQATRTTVLRGQNLLKSINASNIDDLTRYSGPAGAAKLKLEQGKDLIGNPSEEYLRHLDALQAAKLEAKEVRQFFGDSITPGVQDALYEMVNATSLTKSPEAAKRMIQKSRDTIKKQVDTFAKALSSPEPYQQLSQELQAGTNGIEMITIRNPKTGETRKISRAEFEAGRKKE